MYVSGGAGGSYYRYYCLNQLQVSIALDETVGHQDLADLFDIVGSPVTPVSAALTAGVVFLLSLPHLRYTPSPTGVLTHCTLVLAHTFYIWNSICMCTS